MLYRKEGIPEEGEIVLCTVTQVQYNSVFVRMDEYDKSGMIHISEIAPGRIRNIRDFVKEGKIIVCKVLRYYISSGHFDLSLRRVTEVARRKKLDELKQEQKAEKIVEIAARQLKTDFKELYDKLTENIFAKYGSLNECFNEVSAGNIELVDLGVEKEIADLLNVTIKQKIKPVEIILKGEFEITSYAPEGVDSIKKALSMVKDPSASIRYIKAGLYRIEVKGEGEDYKTLEDKLKKCSDAVLAYAEKNHIEAKFTKIETK